jgi:hypothetical protein
MPGARIVSGDEHPQGHQHHVRVAVSAAVGRVKRPAGVGPAGDDCRNRQHPAEHKNVPARQVELRERQVAGADHHRQQEIAEHGRNRWNQEEENHDHAVKRKQPVVGFRDRQVTGRRHELQPEQNRRRAADKEEQRDRDHVQNGDPLVVGRPQPRPKAIVGVQVIAASGRLLDHRSDV